MAILEVRFAPKTSVGVRRWRRRRRGRCNQKHNITRIGVFVQGQILCISPNGLQAGHCDAPTPFWMTENEFRSHFSPFQINTQLFIFLILFTKWQPVAILDDQKSLFDRISRHFRSIRNFIFLFTKLLPAAILDDRKSLSIAFLAISDQYSTFFFILFTKLPAAILENPFRSHFSPFQINTQLFFCF